MSKIVGHIRKDLNAFESTCSALRMRSASTIAFFLTIIATATAPLKMNFFYDATIDNMWGPPYNVVSMHGLTVLISSLEENLSTVRSCVS
ncbi:hypothetical protein Y032_0025g1276 [Ancylostoma ceylanicum]|nr:hypothetical protein Y032_0025g1276 [Ancylostoma ceylanicum]